MNLFSRWRALFLSVALILFFVNSVWAIQVASVYLSGCKRVIGIIVHVDDEAIQLLTMEGTIQRIPRFDMTYVAYYPLGSNPVKKITNPEVTDLITITSLYNNNVVELLQGWMVNYSEDKISFLTLQGDETVVDINDIWDLKIGRSFHKVTFRNGEHLQYHFVHPYPFAYCEESDVVQKEEPRIIYPQHLLGNPLLIKKELDRLKKGHDKIHEYYSDKQFYPIPQIYGNHTSLGIGLNFGSRYGGSKSRQNNLTPLLVSELSEGPFGFQRVLITGSGPMPYSVHEEAQTQFYYELKADYVHFSLWYDIIRLFIGEENYYWHKDDLKTYDDRLNQIFHIGGGFDFGNYSFDFTLATIQYAIRKDDLFFTHRVNFNKTGLFYHNRFVKIDLYYGFATDQKEDTIIIRDDDSPEQKAEKERLKRELDEEAAYYTDIAVYRANITLPFLKKLRPQYSFIYRTIDFSIENDWKTSTGAFRYASKSFTNAFYLNYDLGNDLTLFGYVAAETHFNRYGITKRTESSYNNYYKGGINIAIQF